MSEPRLRLLDATLRLDSMPAAGRDVTIRPTDDDRVAIAALIGVTSVDALTASLHAIKFRGGFRVTGTVKAQITQPSVVSLEPVTQSIDEPVDRIFLPSGEKEYAGPAGAEVFVDLEGEDLPDHFEGNEADLTDLVVETVALAVDLYPRRDGESLADVVPQADDLAEKPFAALAALKVNKD